MAGIYIHIPFCAQKCSYCNFHFSTNLNLKSEMVNAICKELELRKSELENQKIETVYFGGGTPSLLSDLELNQIFETISKHYDLASEIEFTLEANPDDLTLERIKSLTKTNINRLSIGTQSFFDDDLVLMNRSHNAKQAEESIKFAQDYGFENITIDLIYGIQTSSNQKWRKNLEKFKALNVPHLSAYALTVEPKTILQHQISTGKVKSVDEEEQYIQFSELQDFMSKNGFVQYEISNFGKPDFFSKHNSSYWKGKLYLGIGPSAHSFDGKQRSWNVSNNKKYLDALNQNQIPQTIENLSFADQFNEQIMIGLRTILGIDLNKIKAQFPVAFYDYLIQESQQYLNNGQLTINNEHLILNNNARFFADGIASDLFYLED